MKRDTVFALWVGMALLFGIIFTMSYVYDRAYHKGAKNGWVQSDMHAYNYRLMKYGQSTPSIEALNDMAASDSAFYATFGRKP